MECEREREKHREKEKEGERSTESRVDVIEHLWAYTVL